MALAAAGDTVDSDRGHLEARNTPRSSWLHLVAKHGHSTGKIFLEHASARYDRGVVAWRLNLGEPSGFLLNSGTTVAQ
eukprot:gene13600-biopygen23057